MLATEPQKYIKSSHKVDLIKKKWVTFDVIFLREISWALNYPLKHTIIPMILILKYYPQTLCFWWLPSNVFLMHVAFDHWMQKASMKPVTQWWEVTLQGQFM